MSRPEHEPSWSALERRVHEQRDEARAQRDLARAQLAAERITFSHGIDALQNTSGDPSMDFDGAIEHHEDRWVA